MLLAPGKPSSRPPWLADVIAGADKRERAENLLSADCNNTEVRVVTAELGKRETRRVKRKDTSSFAASLARRGAAYTTIDSPHKQLFVTARSCSCVGMATKCVGVSAQVLDWHLREPSAYKLRSLPARVQLALQAQPPRVHTKIASRRALSKSAPRFKDRAAAATHSSSNHARVHSRVTPPSRLCASAPKRLATAWRIHAVHRLLTAAPRRAQAPGCLRLLPATTPPLSAGPSPSSSS